MNNLELYTIWAREESPWSTWAKPVLFATINHQEADNTSLPAISTVGWAPPSNSSTAFIVDIPGEDSVITGLALAASGYQPVPLYNCCAGPGMLVNVTPIVHALIIGGESLSQIDLSPNAPPAFLLDSNRLNNSHLKFPGSFDNRWCVVPQDMPSSASLKKMGIQTIVLRSDSIQDDLAHILLRYQESGLEIKISRPNEKELMPIKVSKPPGFKSLFYRWQVLIGLSRNSAGGFGAVVPEPSSAGG